MNLYLSQPSEWIEKNFKSETVVILLPSHLILQLWGMLALACIWSLIFIFHLFLLISLPYNNNKKIFSSSPPLTSAPQLKEIVGRLRLSLDRDWVTSFVVCVYLGGLSLLTIPPNQAPQRMGCSGKDGHNLVGLHPAWSSKACCYQLKAWRMFLFELALLLPVVTAEVSPVGWASRLSGGQGRTGLCQDLCHEAAENVNSAASSLP